MWSSGIDHLMKQETTPPFTTPQISQVLRDIAESMKTYTWQPSTCELERVVTQLTTQYPHICLVDKKVSTPAQNMVILYKYSVVIWKLIHLCVIFLQQVLVEKLRLIFNRWRLKRPNEGKEKTGRGRPKVLKEDKSPGNAGALVISMLIHYWIRECFAILFQLYSSN